MVGINHITLNEFVSVDQDFNRNICIIEKATTEPQFMSPVTGRNHLYPSGHMCLHSCLLSCCSILVPQTSPIDSFSPIDQSCVWLQQYIDRQKQIGCLIQDILDSIWAVPFSKRYSMQCLNFFFFSIKQLMQCLCSPF